MDDLKHFTKEDCGKLMTQEESRKVQIAMLDALASFCDRHNLRYYLSGGTLLGAVRHNGFIPWDDDIDVNMPRPDVEKLYKLTNGRIENYVLTRPDTNLFSRNTEYFRLYDFKTVIESTDGGVDKKHPVYFPLFIDIFPIEGLPLKSLSTKLHYLKIIFLRKMQRSSSLDHLAGKNIWSIMFHVVSAIPAKLVGYKKWCTLIEKTACKYDFNKQEYIGVMTCARHTLCEKVHKQEYIKYKDVMFEGKKYHGPSSYDTYLTQLYGPDYMELPPMEEQKTHHDFNIYWKK